MSELMSLKSRLMTTSWVQVTKPGIVSGNAIAVLGGYFLAARDEFHLLTLLSALLGTMLVIASGCVANNIIDRDIDGTMSRTRNRVLVTGHMAVKTALIYSIALLSAGVLVLSYCGDLAVKSALFGYGVYVGLYSLYFKRHSIWGTLIGSFSGAIPPVIGYAAVTNQADAAYWILFAMFSIWQLPHAYAIAIFRDKDYLKANIPVLPLRVSFTTTRVHMIVTIAAFATIASLLTLLGYTGWIYLTALLLLSGMWLQVALQNVPDRAAERGKWARKIFGYSVAIITVLSFCMAIHI
ncbi:heme o synthase [Spirabiliibacterium pneumoniae]|uniref:heme o synthase n=1 Tax=Spirabiliibacterium pneumoniae TaxID=221400 RepID=UPI001AADBF75|nr:heme o synthase [Spirabiliibacterium pneumoniae]